MICFYWQLLSTSTPFFSTKGLATPFKDSGPCLPCPQLPSAHSLPAVSNRRSPAQEASELGSPLCPVTAAAEPMVGGPLWLCCP